MNSRTLRRGVIFVVGAVWVMVAAFGIQVEWVNRSNLFLAGAWFIAIAGLWEDA